jgi:hypothetical protein
MAVSEVFREWDGLDVLAVGGMLMTTGGVVASLVPRFRRIELLFPIAIGAAMMTAAAFGARHSTAETISGTVESDLQDAIGSPPPGRYRTPA